MAVLLIFGLMLGTVALGPARAGAEDLPAADPRPDGLALLGPTTYFGAGVSIPDQGRANPFPSVIRVENEGPRLENLTLRLSTVNHGCVRDLDILLVAPTGKSTVLMSDDGDSALTPLGCKNIHATSIQFRSDCPSFPDPVPEELRTAPPTKGLCARPSDDDTPPHQGDDWGVPGTHKADNLDTFNGINPSGDWKLYVVDDQSGDSGSIVQWSLTLTTSNRHPTAHSSTYTAHKGTLANLTLQGTDPDGDTLHCTSDGGDLTRGVLTGSGCNISYLANPRTTGTDILYHRVTDPWNGYSEWVTSRINIVNRPPTATNVNVTVAPGAAVPLPLGGTDPDPQEIPACTSVAASRLGTVSGTGCNRTYTAGPAQGTESFTYVVDDGFGGLAQGTITVKVDSGAPTALDLSTSVGRGQASTLALRGTDPKGLPLTCQAPTSTVQAKGTLTGTGCSRTYTAGPRTTGTDTFQYTVTNSEGAVSLPATVTYRIQNREPTAPRVNLTVPAGDRVALSLTGTDPDPGETHSLGCRATATEQTRGTVRGSGCNVTYQAPAAVGNGTDVFSYVVEDGMGGTGYGQVLVTVVAPRTLPGCSSGDNANARLVCRTYLDLLGRTADPGGKAYWLKRLNAGESRNRIIATFTDTNEYRNSVVRGIYRDVLGLAPTSAELTVWAARLKGGASPDVVRQGVLGSTAFWSASANDGTSFAAGLYRKTLRREATAAEVAAVLRDLSNGVTRERVAAKLLAAREGDTVVVATIYERFLRRSPPAAETTYWVNRFQRGDPELTLVRGIIASNEYFNNA